MGFFDSVVKVFTDPIGSLVNAGVSVLGSSMQAKGASAANASSAYEAKMNRNFQASEAVHQRNWTTEMSNTAHQREVADLRAAGLNPILSGLGGSGASSSGGAMAGSVGNPVMQNEYAGFGELANTARRIQEVEKARVEFERDLAREKVQTEKKSQTNLESNAYLNYELAAKAATESAHTQTRNLADIWSLKWLKPQELSLLQSQTSNQLSQAGMNSAYGAKAQTDKLVQDLILNRHSISKEIEPYTQVGKEVGDTADKIGEGIWKVLPWRKPMPFLPLTPFSK